MTNTTKKTVFISRLNRSTSSQSLSIRKHYIVYSFTAWTWQSHWPVIRELSSVIFPNFTLHPPISTRLNSLSPIDVNRTMWISISYPSTKCEELKISVEKTTCEMRASNEFWNKLTTSSHYWAPSIGVPLAQLDLCLASFYDTQSPLQLTGNELIGRDQRTKKKKKPTAWGLK